MSGTSTVTLLTAAGPASGASTATLLVSEAPATTLVSAAMPAINLLAVGEGIQGPPGPPGGSPGAYIAERDIRAGQPVRVSRATGKAGIADAAAYPDAFVIGCAAADALAGFPVDVLLERVLLVDWTSIAGQPTLSAGTLYFLRAGGGITPVAPARPSSVASTVVGMAAAPNVLFVKPANPVLL